MTDFKNTFQIFKQKYFPIAGALLLILLALFLLWFNNSTSLQASPALVAQVYFDGEYRINDGEWQKIAEGGHIPATKGDVTLRGNFHMLDPEGGYVGIYRGDLPIAFYTDHINLTFYETGAEPFVIDMENPVYGDSVCGVGWTACFFSGENEEQIEILVHNPHSFGNETAIDEMLSSIALWTGIEFEKDVLSNGEPQKNVGMLLMLVSLVFLGIALFSGLIHIKSNRIIGLFGQDITVKDLTGNGHDATAENSVVFTDKDSPSDYIFTGLKLYVDGALVAQRDHTSEVNSNKFAPGVDIDQQQGRTLRGLLAGIQIYSRALDASEVLALNPNAVLDGAIVAYDFSSSEP